MFTLAEVVPWGRSFKEYEHMFALTAADLAGRLVGCGDGPASFNAEATRLGVRVISCDPIYRFDREQLRTRIDEAAPGVIEQTRRNAGEFVWTSIASVEELEATRMAAMNAFLDDYAAGRAEGRYLDAALPSLPFADGTFDLALSSHLLFLYSDQLGLDFHVGAAREMCRIAADVRIFPLLALGGRPSPHVAPVREALTTAGFEVLIEAVPYEFQRGGDEMMRISRRTPRGSNVR